MVSFSADIQKTVQFNATSYLFTMLSDVLFLQEINLQVIGRISAFSKVGQHSTSL